MMGVFNETVKQVLSGLNPTAVEISARLGAKVIWMPTLSSHFHQERIKSDRPGIYIIDAKGRVVPPALKILDVIREYDVVLATGHLSPEEILVLLDETQKRGLKTLATHPNWACTLEQQQCMVAKGAFIEFSFLSVMPTLRRLSPDSLVSQIRSIGPENCILTSDFGWPENPPPAEGMRMAIATLHKYGMTRQELELMVKRNPAKLLGLHK